MKKALRAFTLIELLVVVAIIGILAAVGVVAYNGYTKAAKAGVAKANHKMVIKFITNEIARCEIEDTVMNGNLTCSGRSHQKVIDAIVKSFGKGSVQTIIPFRKPVITGIRLTTARYYTPSGQSIQGKGITPDVIVEQGKFESNEFKRLTESDFKNSLDKEEIKKEEDSEKTPQEERLQRDFQLARAVDLIIGIDIYKESLAQ